MLADHLRKPGPNDTSSNSMPRGSTDKTAAVDTVLSIRKCSNRISVTHSKSRHAPPVEGFDVEVTDQSDNATTITATNSAPSPRVGKVENARRLVLSELEGGPLSRQELIDLGDVSVKHLDEALV